MTVNILNKIIFGAKRIAYQLKEKPKVSLDDQAIEHMVFYHGLTGSSPENEKETKFVRADIKEALSNKSGTALCLALKLSPTIWQDRLSEIFSQLSDDQRQMAIKLLAEGDSGSIVYPDWRVRANAANILAWLDAKEAAPALAASLESGHSGRPQWPLGVYHTPSGPATVPLKPAPTDGALSFCYVAYALGKLQGEQAKAALQKHLHNEDSWLRVDAAGALAYFDFESTAPLLAQAMLDEQEALDYMAYAISRQHKPARFLQYSSVLLTDARLGKKNENQTDLLLIIKGGCRLIYGIIEAARNSFSGDLIFETESHLCLPQLMQLIENNCDPILVDTAMTLSGWLAEPAVLMRADKSRPYQISQRQTDDVREQVIKYLKIALQNDSLSAAELTHSIKLAGRLKIKEAQPLLCQLLMRFDPGSGLKFGSQINCLIAALAEFGDGKTSAALIDFANGLVNVKERCQKPLSKQPVWEGDPANATAYWQILKALGNVQAGAGGDFVPLVNKTDCRGEIYPPTYLPPVSFLYAALADYAPDKRAEALTSLMTLHKNNPQLSLPEPADSILQRALKDPSPIVQLAALTAIANLEQVDLIVDIMPLIDAQENTVSKQALAGIACLYKSNKLNQASHATARQEIKAALQAKLKMIKEEHKKIGIMDILREE